MRQDQIPHYFLNFPLNTIVNSPTTLLNNSYKDSLIANNGTFQVTLDGYKTVIGTKKKIVFLEQGTDPSTGEKYRVVLKSKNLYGNNVIYFNDVGDTVEMYNCGYWYITDVYNQFTPDLAPVPIYEN